ncbi:MAG: hypothetical protein AAF390_21530 [Pseudomonadota bacterium]
MRLRSVAWASGALAALIPMGPVLAAGIDFGGVTPGAQAGDIVTPEATITGFSSTLIFGPETGAPEGLCGDFSGTGLCDGIVSITFATPVTGLSFDVLNAGPGDLLEVVVDDVDAGLFGAGTESVDLSGFGAVEELTLLAFLVPDLPEGDGDAVAYANFTFDGPAPVIPLPATSWLLLAGLGAFSAAGWGARRSAAAPARR